MIKLRITFIDGTHIEIQDAYTREFSGVIKTMGLPTTHITLGNVMYNKSLIAKIEQIK